MMTGRSEWFFAGLHGGGPSEVSRGGFAHSGVSHAAGNVTRGSFGHGSSLARGGHFGGGGGRR